MLDSTSPMHLPGTRPRVAIVSTYDDLCGIAGYTRALVDQLSPYMDVTVFDLDQYLIRNTHRRVQKLADQHVKDIAARLGEFDSVNVQLEHGTLGRTPRSIIRRFRWLAEAARNLSVTFHTVLSDTPVPWDTVFQRMVRGRVGEAVALVDGTFRASILSRGIYSTLRSLRRKKPVHVIVHTKRDMRLLRDVYRIRDITHHPLVYASPEKANRIRAAASRDTFPALRNLPPGAKLVGTFGFLSPYKGFETAIQAMRYLGPEYHLLVFGGIHPQTIRRHQPLDPYIAKMLAEGHIGDTLVDHLATKGATLQLPIGTGASEMLQRHPQDLSDRIHFMGVLSDEGFMSAMSVCDCVVLPYLEVGQSSSGPISMAIDMGSRIIASRTAAFLQFSRYHPDQIEFFDIGNYAELAERIRSESPVDCLARKPLYTAETNAMAYLGAMAAGEATRQDAEVTP